MPSQNDPHATPERPGTGSPPAPREEVEQLAHGTCHDPHRILGAHMMDGRVVVRVWRPDATAVTVDAEGTKVILEPVHPAGLFAGYLPEQFTHAPAYRLEVTYGDRVFDLDDPYRFLPTVGDLDLYLLAEGRHERLWEVLGAGVRTHEGAPGTAFAVWAPNARAVRVVGDHNSWDGLLHPMRSLGASGVWELFLPGVGPGTKYKYEIVQVDGTVALKADPMARSAEPPPGNASIVHVSSYEWGDQEWLAHRAHRQPLHEPMSVYEVHLGSWRRGLDYRELAHQLAEYAVDLGFTHVELLPVTEYPYDPSWGYQVTSYYAPTSRFGSPDDFRYLVDHLHQRGVGVIADWVPAHFPKDAFALARFDGTSLYEHTGNRGEHPEWGSLVFNFGRNEVRNFLVANALYWLEEFHLDGLRVDAVASMLYLDYSREPGDWVPNEHGGREDLDAVRFLQELNAAAYRHHPGIVTIAEESTAWPGVSRPVHTGGLGFGFKWNMGWMHDTLDYIGRDPVHRRHHHNDLTFSLVYAFSENYVLPISHDEVVHGKRSLVGRMPGDHWQRFANLRAYLAFMWAHPGKQLLFMGCEIAQESEWSEQRSIDWEGLADPLRRGVQDLVRDLNHTYRDAPELWQRDAEPAGFTWLQREAAQENVLAFVRWSSDGRPMVVLVNFSSVPQHRRIGLPHGGPWRTVLNTDDQRYGGSGVVPAHDLHGDGSVAWDGQPASAEVTFPPLAVAWLVPGH